MTKVIYNEHSFSSDKEAIHNAPIRFTRKEGQVCFNENDIVFMVYKNGAQALECGIRAKDLAELIVSHVNKEF